MVLSYPLAVSPRSLPIHWTSKKLKLISGLSVMFSQFTIKNAEITFSIAWIDVFYFSFHDPQINLRKRLRTCPHDPGGRQLTHPVVNLASGARSDNCSHKFFVAPGQNWQLWGRLPIVQHRVNQLAEVTFLHVKRTQKLLRGKSSLARAHYWCYYCE